MNIEFRGLSKKSNEWVFGSLLSMNEKKCIYQDDYGDLSDVDFWYAFEDVTNNSVGQLLKSTGKNNGKLFVGDICRLYNEKGKLEDGLKVIVDKGDFFAFDYSSMPVSVLIDLGCSVEVVGNVFQNPELLVKD